MLLLLLRIEKERKEGKYFNDNLPKDTIPAYFLYRDAPEAQRHVSNQRLGRRATSSSEKTVNCASEIGLKCAINSEH